MSELNVDKLILSGKLTIPSYTDATRPSLPDTGLIIFNSGSKALEVFNGDEWKSIGGGALFEFTTHTFTPASTVGRFGPTITTLRNSYSSATWAADPNFFFEGRSQGYQVFKIPKTGIYEIETAGARGDNSSNPTSGRGRGAIIRARFTFQINDTLEMLVGQVPGNGTGTSATSYCGSGGGSFVAFYGTNTPIIVAGGGAGIYSTNPPQAVRDGQTRRRPTWTFAGNNSAGAAVSYSPGVENTNPADGQGGHGYHGGGGGGFFTSGGVYPGRAIGDSANTGAGNTGQQYTHGAGFCGQDYTTFGGIGGTFYGIGGNATAAVAGGGFGGGGGGHSGNNSSGGGGGYSGGMGGQTSLGGNILTGTGGGSFIATSNSASTVATSNGQYEGSSTFSGSSITNLNSFNDDSGYIKITFIG